MPWLPVKFLGRCAGLVSSHMGPTHQSTEELALLRALPGLAVLTPASPKEAEAAVRAAYSYDGPVYIRLEGTGEPEIYGPDHRFELGSGVTVRPGGDAAIFSMGSEINEALAAAEQLRGAGGPSVRVVNIHTVKPLDRELIAEAVRQIKAALTVEEHSLYGGLGSAVAEVIATEGLRTKFKMLGLAEPARGCGDRAWLRRENGLAANQIAAALKSLL